MSLVVHIPFYNPYPEKLEGPNKKNRLYFLKKTIANIKKINLKKIDIFVHTHNDYLKSKKIKAEVIVHKINNHDLKKGYLTWKPRKLMQSQKHLYNYFMYIEHDINFDKKNFQYWLKYSKILLKYNFNLGFIVTEKNSENKKYSLHIKKKFNQYVLINNKKFIVNDDQPYCCMWIYDKKNFNNFVNTKWWNFNWRGKNYISYYGVTEMSSIGWHGKQMDNFKSTIIPLRKNSLDDRCFISHNTNNYIFRKVRTKENLKFYCRYKIGNLIDTKNLRVYKEITGIKIFLLKLKFFFRFIEKIRKTKKERWLSG